MTDVSGGSRQHPRESEWASVGEMLAPLSDEPDVPPTHGLRRSSLSGGPVTGSQQPSEVAARSNFWTLSITDLDLTIDRLEARIDVLVQSDGTPRKRGQELREAAVIVRRVRDRLLAENYDANRRGKGVTER